MITRRGETFEENLYFGAGTGSRRELQVSNAERWVTSFGSHFPEITIIQQ